uniref:succinate dehydrogenase subunit 4 n=1 Tax=Fragaria iinumae TaxID=64939 RepID=UPI001FF48727|nr:succinate dehydrogenase subunit 4 [Fragaria iinumae]UNS17515.1 succinate dehydrogenase subunit 4 [Fragaria iinumae]
MVLAFCRRGSVIPICLYLLVGRYMKERKSELRNESSSTKRRGLWKRMTASLILLSICLYKKVFPTQFICILPHNFRDRRDYGRSCSPKNDPRIFLLLFQLVPFNRNQRCFLVSRFFSEQIEEPNGSLECHSYSFIYGCFVELVGKRRRMSPRLLIDVV